MLTAGEITAALEAAHRHPQQVDGRLVVTLPGGRHQVWIELDEAGPSLCVQLRSVDRIARGTWAAVLVQLDAWNREERLAKSFLVTDDWSSDESAGLVTETSLPLDHGVDAGRVVPLVDLTAAAGARCWRRVADGLVRRA